MSKQRRYPEARVEALPNMVVAARQAGLYRCSGRPDESGHRVGDGKSLSSAGKVLAAELWTYAYPALKVMLRDCLVVPQLRRLGVPTPVLTAEQIEAITQTDGHRHDLAGAMIVRALPRFLERVVVENKWDPVRSALTTHFVNACLLAYPDVVKQWIKERYQLTSGFDELGLVAVRQDTELVIENRELVRAVVLRAPERIRPILTWLWLGYTVTEVAEKLKLNPSTIRSRLFEFRKGTLLPLVRSGQLIPPHGHVLQASRLAVEAGAR
jgi:hypothetical protein